MDKNFEGLTKKQRRALKKKLKKEKRERLHHRNQILHIALIVIAFIIAGGLLWLLVKKNSSTATTSSVKEIKLLADDRIKGAQDATASATLIEYSDFQCPACGAYFPMVKKLTEEFDRKVKFVYRHFPLRQIHPYAELAAQAAEAAALQDKFWPMHDLIFENQSSWSKLEKEEVKETFVSYAKELELDVEQFKTDLESDKVKDKVKRDYQSGLKLGVNATPTFFLNGKKIDNPKSYEEFTELIRKALRENNSTSENPSPTPT